MMLGVPFIRSQIPSAHGAVQGGSLAVVVVTAVAALAGCGGGARTTDESAAGPRSASSGVSAWEASLRADGWKVHEVAGMPHTVTGAAQVAYFEARSPRGAMVDVQVFATAAQARAERAAAELKLKGFHASTIAHAIAFSRGPRDGPRRRAAGPAWRPAVSVARLRRASRPLTA